MIIHAEDVSAKLTQFRQSVEIEILGDAYLSGHYTSM